MIPSKPRRCLGGEARPGSGSRSTTTTSVRTASVAISAEAVPGATSVRAAPRSASGARRTRGTRTPPSGCRGRTAGLPALSRRSLCAHRVEARGDRRDRTRRRRRRARGTGPPAAARRARRASDRRATAGSSATPTSLQAPRHRVRVVVRSVSRPGPRRTPEAEQVRAPRAGGPGRGRRTPHPSSAPTQPGRAAARRATRGRRACGRSGIRDGARRRRASTRRSGGAGGDVPRFVARILRRPRVGCFRTEIGGVGYTCARARQLPGDGGEAPDLRAGHGNGEADEVERQHDVVAGTEHGHADRADGVRSIVDEVGGDEVAGVVGPDRARRRRRRARPPAGRRTSCSAAAARRRTRAHGPPRASRGGDDRCPRRRRPATTTRRPRRRTPRRRTRRPAGARAGSCRRRASPARAGAGPRCSGGAGPGRLRARTRNRGAR